MKFACSATPTRMVFTRQALGAPNKGNVIVAVEPLFAQTDAGCPKGGKVRSSGNCLQQEIEETINVDVADNFHYRQMVPTEVLATVDNCLAES